MEGTGGRAFKVAHNAGSLGHRSVSHEDGSWTGHKGEEDEEEEKEHGERCWWKERGQMDRGVREAAGYRQGRNCVSGARLPEMCFRHADRLGEREQEKKEKKKERTGGEGGAGRRGVVGGGEGGVRGPLRKNWFPSGKEGEREKTKKKKKKKKKDGEREESNMEGCIARMAGGVRKGLESQL